jgi:SagB-type dehydrogenase family enzyme
MDLPTPDRAGGIPLMLALARRRSDWSFSSEDLDLQTLSDLLWAALGVNRENGNRTAPTARNRQEITVYCALRQGCYRYDADKHQLEMVTEADLRAQTGRQGFVADAPLNLVYVADLSKASSEFYAGCDTGFVAQNVYLCCASKGLASVVRGWVDRERLAEAMRISEPLRVVLCQTVGWPG